MMESIKKEVKLAFTENKGIIVASILIFFISLILGYVFEPSLYSYFNPLVEDLTNKVQSGIIKITFHDIFLNNIMVVFRMFIYGLFFCISVLSLAFNGFFVGYFMATVPNLTSALILIIPHGIFEFPSCILACSSGLILFKFAYNLLKTFIKQKEMKFIDRIVYTYSENFDILAHALIILFVASILMVIAGIVEAYVTLPLGSYLMSIIS
ncbi:stage II sporulation protein M [Methanobrevibacter sp.]|uniref:stage II sporulation protein M n=1 Tax=Methanobrevibacter sp. TaxID=66852 RepID=UPI00388D4368